MPISRMSPDGGAQCAAPGTWPGQGRRDRASWSRACPALASGSVALAAGVADAAEHGLSQSAVEIARPFGFPITNSMVVTWIVAVGLIVFARVATRRMNEVPDGAQNLLEWLIESLYKFLEGIIGPHLVERTFWFFAHDLHLHPGGELVRSDPRRRVDRLGPSDRARLRARASRCFAAPTPTST